MKVKRNLKPIYTITGTIIHGRGIGKHVGTPTANLKNENREELPENGVYTAEIVLNNQIYYGVTHIGTRPTVDNDNDISIETHILNFDMDIYGCLMTVKLYQKFRGIHKFDNLSQLLEQIKKDCQSAREFWGVKQSKVPLLITYETHYVSVDSQNIYLSAKEFEVLYMLYSNPTVSFTKEQIYKAIWHEPTNNYFHAVENTIFQIRKRLKPYSNGYDFIKTIVGYGYKFNTE